MGFEPPSGNVCPRDTTRDATTSATSAGAVVANAAKNIAPAEISPPPPITSPGTGTGISGTGMDSTPVGAVDASGTVLGTVRESSAISPDIAASPSVRNGERNDPSGFSSAADHIRNASNAAADRVTAVATVLASAPSSASGMSSAMVIHTMHPAANPMANGSNPANVSTKRNAGTASRGCGREVMTAHAAHFHAGTPREARTVATAIPSGMLWTPMAV